VSADPKASFDGAISLTTLESGFRVDVPENWTAAGRAAGGLVEAQLLAAAEEAMRESEKRPLSFTAHLLRAPEMGSADVAVDVLRDGRSLANLSVSMTQNAKLIATALVSFATERDSPRFDELPAPDVEPPSGRENTSYIPEFAYPYGDNIVIQDRVGPAPFSAPDGPMERVGWVGLSAPRRVDAPQLVLMGDIGMMGWWARLDRMHTTATLDHTTYFRADLDAIEVDDLVLMSSTTRLVQDGYLDWDVVLWAPDGTVLAQSRQLLAVLGVSES
jgi:acyl-CoA thioesterase